MTVEQQLEAERTVRRQLAEALRQILGPNPNWDPEGQHDFGWEQPPPKPFAPNWVADIAHIALAASDALDQEAT